MEFNRILAACAVVTAAVWALERGLKQAAEKNRQRDEYRVYENAGGLLLTIVIALIVLLFVWRADGAAAHPARIIYADVSRADVSAWPPAAACLALSGTVNRRGNTDVFI